MMVSELVLRHQLMMIGEILCKFCSGELEIRNLGRYLRDKTTSSFQPHFIIAERSRLPTEDTKIEISQRTISYMIEQADFRLGDITINVSGEHMITDISLSILSGHSFPISGFPRALMQRPPPNRRLFREISLFLYSSTAYIIL